MKREISAYTYMWSGKKGLSDKLDIGEKKGLSDMHVFQFFCVYGPVDYRWRPPTLFFGYYSRLYVYISHKKISGPKYRLISTYWRVDLIDD